MPPILQTNSWIGLTSNNEFKTEMMALKKEWHEYQVNQDRINLDHLQRLEAIIHTSAGLINMYQEAMRRYVPDYMEPKVEYDEHVHTPHTAPAVPYAVPAPAVPYAVPAPPPGWPPGDL